MKYLFLCLFCLFVSCGDANAYTFENVKYVRNYDGDTATFNILWVHPLIGDRVPVRLKDIDTPEITDKDPGKRLIALAAKKYLEDVLKKAKRIDLVDVERGSFFRLLANVIADGKNVSDLLKERGFDEEKVNK